MPRAGAERAAPRANQRATGAALRIACRAARVAFGVCGDNAKRAESAATSRAAPHWRFLRMVVVVESEK
jgi:hypothetical protein